MPNMKPCITFQDFALINYIKFLGALKYFHIFVDEEDRMKIEVLL